MLLHCSSMDNLCKHYIQCTKNVFSKNAASEEASYYTEIQENIYIYS